VLIYFDRATQDRAVGLLERLLADTGTLFVGPSETGLLLSHDFTSAKLPMAFAFRKSVAAPPEVRPARRSQAPAAPPRPSQPVVPRRPPRPAAPPALRPAPVAQPTYDIAEAARLADQGRLAEAARLCEEHMRVHGCGAAMIRIEIEYITGKAHRRVAHQTFLES